VTFGNSSQIKPGSELAHPDLKKSASVSSSNRFLKTFNSREDFLEELLRKQTLVAKCQRGKAELVDTLHKEIDDIVRTNSFQLSSSVNLLEQKQQEETQDADVAPATEVVTFLDFADPNQALLAYADSVSPDLQLLN